MHDFKLAAPDGLGSPCSPVSPPLPSHGRRAPRPRPCSDRRRRAAARRCRPPPAAAAPAAADQRAAPTIAPQYAELARKLAKTLPEYTIERISPSGVDGILEVLMEGNRIVYTDTSGKHLFNGHLFDIDAHEDLTERRIEALTRIDVKQLPLADAFDVVHGDGKRQLYLFEDPDCPYCKKFEEQLPKINNVTLHIFCTRSRPFTRMPTSMRSACGVRRTGKRAGRTRC
jgi:hypothetical protein